MFGQAIRTCFRKSLTFSGRAGRPEFWFFALFAFLCLLGADEIDVSLFGPGAGAPVSSFCALVLSLPILAAAWRRMHDTGRSGLYVVYPLIVFVGLTTWVGVVGGGEMMSQGYFAGALTVFGGVLFTIGVFVLMISPLLVVWWLTRPSQSIANEWGPPPKTAGDTPEA